jgi:hypothetical protein
MALAKAIVLDRRAFQTGTYTEGHLKSSLLNLIIIMNFNEIVYP